jgi:chromosome segregation ATPase
VSQPDLVSSFWSADDQPCREPETVSDDGCLALPPVGSTDQDLLSQLAQSQSLEQQRAIRIYHLEQALDQALACLSDLRMQLQNQEILEAQLATTEEFAYVQQQAIARLKQQLRHQQQLLEAHISGTQGRDHTVQTLLSTTEAMTQTQQAELERLQTRIAQDWTKIQTHRSSLEQQIEDIKAALDSRQQRILELESEVLATRTQNISLEVQLNAAQNQIESLRRTRTIASEQETTIANLKRDLAMTQIKVEELETQLAKQLRWQARWQQNCQEAEAERDRYQARTAELTQQTSEMQDQIFAQARQAGEYEAAVQHWKDRYLNSQRQMAQLKELLEQAISQSALSNTHLASDALLEWLAAIQPESSKDLLDAPLSPASRFSTLDLPDFLVRHRSYRNR